MVVTKTNAPLWVVCGGGVTWGGEEGGGDEVMEMVMLDPCDDLMGSWGQVWHVAVCSDDGYDCGDDVILFVDVVFVAAAGGSGRKPTGVAPEK
ncbi:hypothetical protein Tco_0740427 [Tanacetum coccineum]